VKLNAHIPPDSTAATAAHRAVLAIGARRVAGRGDPRSGALARALRDSALGRRPPEEREWIARVEAHRAEIPFAMAATGAPIGLVPSDEQSGPVPVPDDATRLGHAWEACRWAAIPPVWGRFLTRLVRELNPVSCLELGTGTGLSASYQAAALELNGRGTLMSLDFQEVAAIAERGLGALGLDHRIELRVGPIDETLPGLLERIAPIDYAFLDAEHSEEATTRHFEAVLPHLADGAVVVLDDVTATPEMRRAWRAVINRDRVSLALGLRRLGVVAISGPPPSG
jgi:predicted O-methyltransferase YrrM